MNPLEKIYSMALGGGNTKNVKILMEVSALISEIDDFYDSENKKKDSVRRKKKEIEEQL